MGMPSRRRDDRVTLSLRVSADLAARVREFVRDNAGKPLFLTISGFAEQALEAHLDALARQLASEDPARRRSSPTDNSHR